MRMKVRMRTRLVQNENEGKNDDEMRMRTKKMIGMRLEMSIRNDELRNTECKMEKTPRPHNSFYRSNKVCMTKSII